MPDNEVKFRTIDLSAEARRIWGKHWNAPETSYEFSSGRKFQLRTEDASAYDGSQTVGDAIQKEFTAADIASGRPGETFYILQENGDKILRSSNG